MDYHKFYSDYDLSILKAYYSELQKLYDCDTDISFPNNFDEFVKGRVEDALNDILLEAFKFLCITKRM